ncbi:hypothetical protein C2I18_21205 [Paenibacillus sp. PK3_47]|uniref:restriction endonuclease subunit S n=1 Tax=Paenibacillus sp. PK3_47 TaxID=2072642 RepID=UPI00201E2E5C|nr:restriction endonuclease subunit S [Paenibacillus sp. PK3_47]UQZ35825.1 hypothetical protein C2I18_21205 [Paenibacillus sp. PK3_47]
MSKNKGKTAEELLQEALVPVEEQPYKVPENWVWVKLGNISVIKRGASPRPKGDPKYFNGLIPWLKISDVTKQGKYIFETEDTVTEEGKEKSVWVEPDTIVLSISASVGRPAITKVGVCIHDGFVKIEENKEILNKEYLYYYLVAALNRMLNKAKGAAQVNINSEVVKNLEVALPPIIEQKRIAGKVERLLNKINQAKQLIEEAKETFELRRAAILERAFRGELTEKWQSVECETQSTEKETPFKLPEGWRWSTVEAICEDIIDCPHSTPKYVEEGIPALRTSDIGFAKIDLSDSKKVSEEEYMERTKRTIPKYGDVIYCREGAGIMMNAGNAGMIEDQKVCLAQRLVLLRPNPSIVQYKYFLFGMNSLIIFKQAMKNVSQTTSPRVNVTTIRKFMFPVAPIEVQTEIIKKIETLLEKESLIDFESLSKILGNIEKSIVTKSLRGELDTNDPSEESALKLLEDFLANSK